MAKGVHVSVVPASSNSVTFLSFLLTFPPPPSQTAGDLHATFFPELELFAPPGPWNRVPTGLNELEVEPSRSACQRKYHRCLVCYCDKMPGKVDGIYLFQRSCLSLGPNGRRPPSV